MLDMLDLQNENHKLHDRIVLSVVLQLARHKLSRRKWRVPSPHPLEKKQKKTIHIHPYTCLICTNQKLRVDNSVLLHCARSDSPIWTHVCPVWIKFNLTHHWPSELEDLLNSSPESSSAAVTATSVRSISPWMILGGWMATSSACSFADIHGYLVLGTTLKWPKRSYYTLSLSRAIFLRILEISRCFKTFGCPDLPTFPTFPKSGDFPLPMQRTVWRRSRCTQRPSQAPETWRGKKKWFLVGKIMGKSSENAHIMGIYNGMGTRWNIHWGYIRTSCGYHEINWPGCNEIWMTESSNSNSNMIYHKIFIK